MSDMGDAEPVNILLVDDRPTNLEALEALLRRPDYNLVSAHSGPEALAQVLRGDFALILLDVAMPGMDGFEVASIIKEREQSMLIPIIFVTASVYEMEHVFRGYTVGAVDYLRKPIDPHAVRAKVAVFVELYRQRKQLERQAERLRLVELRHATDALRDSESIYQLTIEEAPIGLGRADHEGRLTRVNHQFAELCGAELVGKKLEELASGDDAAAIAGVIARMRRGEVRYGGEHQLRRADGETILADLRLSALRDPIDGSVRQLIVVVHDITERKSAELERARLVRELQRGIRARDDFIALAAHELRTPLTPLLLQTEGLMRELDRGPVQTLPRRLQAIHRGVVRLERLVDRLLDASVLEVQPAPLHLEDVSLSMIVDRVVDHARDGAERAGSPIVVRRQAEVRGRWDAARLEQALANIVDNAVKYGAGRPIEIALAQVDGAARVSVRDHGIGVAREAREGIFHRFGRHAPLRHYGGFGLGLWSARRIIEAHGGQVHVNDVEGEGAELVVELPLAAEMDDVELRPST